MLIPYQVDVPFDNKPVANWGLIAVTVAVFGFEMANRENIEMFQPFFCTGWDNPIGWFTSLFLHAGILHLVGNMLFLWVFGNAVCSKVGNLTYIPFYLAAGLAGGFAQMASDPTMPSLGASGAINGMVGAYLIFFPTNDISCMLILYFRPIFFTLSSYWIILYFLAWDILGAAVGGGNVGHWAHLGGFAAGLTIAVVMLKTGLVKMQRDELSLLQAIGIDKRPESKQLAHHPSDFYENEMRRVAEMEAAARAEREESVAAAPVPVPQRTIAVGPVAAPAPASRTSPRAVPTAAVAPQGQEELIHFSCSCGKSVKAPRRMAGKSGKCPRCGQKVTIPREC
jgi:membrane associated rhomboid family serine protease